MREPIQNWSEQHASDSDIDAAYAWLCLQRRDWPADTDIWDLRFRWGKDKQQILSGSERIAIVNPFLPIGD